MRIAQVHSSDAGGGAEAVVRLHHQQLLREGRDAKLWVARKTGDGLGIEQIPYLRGLPGSRRLARWLEVRNGWQYLYAPSFRALLESLPSQADLVHLHSLHGAESYAELEPLARLSRRVPVLITMHDLWLLSGHCAYPLSCERWRSGCGNCPDLLRYPAIPKDGTRGNWQRKRKLFARTSLHLSVPSTWVQQQVRQSPILGHLDCSVVPNPIDTGCYFPGPTLAARERLGLPLDRPIVLLVAQHLKRIYKGVADGFKAIKSAAVPDLMVVAIGADAEQALAEYETPGIAVGYQSDPARLADYYRAADLFVMPSRAETFGLVAAEAMACGTPVVAFSAGGLVDVIGNNEGGCLVPEGDIPAMAAAIRDLFNDAPKREALGAQASARALAEFSLSTHTERCLRLYADLASRHRTNTGTPESAKVPL